MDHWRLNHLAVNERPQERLDHLGAEALSDSELLAMVLRSGSKELDVLGLSQGIIKDAGSLSGLLNWEQEDFRKKKGIGKVKSLQLLAVMEIARRTLQQKKGNTPNFDTAEDVYHYLHPSAMGLRVEKFWALSLSSNNTLMKKTEVSSGIANASLAHPREVFRDAILSNATGLIAVHNHPSGNPSPSQQDIKITRQLRDSAAIIGIEFLDHIILGNSDADPRGLGYYSFQENGFI